METLHSLFSSISYSDPVWIAVAYLFGFLVWQIGLPPLVGFLLAGFALNALGATGGEFLSEMADLGVTLLLFTIGLKLNVRQLLKPEVWAVAAAHMAAITLGIATLLWLLAVLGLPLLRDLSTPAALLLGFALSFSSTVFAIKALEERGGMGSQYGRVAIGVLIVQDIAAVIFLAASTAKLPTPWAAVLIIGLVLARPLLLRLLQRAGHGELLILFGLLLALGGATLFELVGLKGDLGALFLGVLLAQRAKAAELAKALLSLKDLFLVGFFLSIGIAVNPDLDTILIALLLILLIPLKTLLFFLLFARFRLRTRQASFAAVSLANYSEFGLIVCAIAVSSGWLPAQWLVVMALAVVLSFILAVPLNAKQNNLFKHMRPWLEELEHAECLAGDEPLFLDNTKALICGVGRIGSGAYEILRRSHGEDGVMGIDFDENKIHFHQRDGHRVIYGDSSNPDFWSRIKTPPTQLESILLCMPNHEANIRSAEAIRAWGYRGQISAIVKYPEEIQALQQAGVNSTFNIFAEIGSGFAQDVLARVETGRSPDSSHST